MSSRRVLARLLFAVGLIGSVSAWQIIGTGPATAPTASAATGATGLPAGFRDERVAGGSDLPAQFQLRTPTGMAFLPDGRILVTEKAGKLQLIKNNLVQPTPALNWVPQTDPVGDAGLIGVAVDPAFATNGYIYLAYTNDSPREGRVSRFTMSGDIVNPASEVVLLTTIADNDSHMIDSVRIGADGYLYASDGDSSPFDTATAASTRAQQPAQTVGKIFRMTRTGQGLPSNPFWTGNANDAASKVYAVGLRNPFRFTVRPDGTVIVGDVGWNSWEEINKISPNVGNHNYGWPCYEGANGTSATRPEFGAFPVCQALLPQGAGAVTAPAFAYDHSVGNSITGGPVYDGTVFPAPYKGAYFFGDYAKSWLNYWPMDAAGNFVGQPVRFANIVNPVDIVLGSDGALYYVSISQGQVRRIAYGAPSASSCVPGNYFAQYYTNATWAGTPAIARCDDTIDNDWGTGGPFGAAPVDNYSVSWSGSQFFTKGANTLTATSDDGSQVWVDGQLVIDNNGDHPATAKSATLSYPAAGFHNVVVKYYEHAGFASAKFTIASVNQAPVPVITAPAIGAQFSAGQVLAAAGSATDPEDGAISGANLQWSVLLHHCPPTPPGVVDVCHTHPYTAFTGSGGNVTAPDTAGDWVWLEVNLTAIDSSGASTSARTAVFPNNCPNESALGKYYPNTTWSGTPAISRCDASVNFNWGTGGPFGASPVDNYSAEWHSPRFFSAGSTNLTITSDDGAQVWVDGQLVIDHNGIHAATSKTGTVNFATAGYHDVFVRYYEAGGDAVAQLTSSASNECASGQARGQYYTNATFTGAPAITRCDAGIDFDWGNGGPFGAAPVDNFSIQWRVASFLPAGTSTLSATSDDGTQVWVDGQLVIDNSGIHPATRKTGTVNFATAAYHDVLVRYTEIGGQASAKLTAPTSNGCPAGQFQGLYYTNQSWSGAPAITRCDASVNFNWVDGGPFGASPVDNFSAQWRQPRLFPAGTSTLSATSDDGTQVWVDGQLVIDNNAIQAATTKTGSVSFPVAGYHDVTVRYYENLGQASAAFSVQ